MLFGMLDTVAVLTVSAAPTKPEPIILIFVLNNVAFCILLITKLNRILIIAYLKFTQNIHSFFSGVLYYLDFRKNIVTILQQSSSVVYCSSGTRGKFCCPMFIRIQVCFVVFVLSRFTNSPPNPKINQLPRRDKKGLSINLLRPDRRLSCSS